MPPRYLTPAEFLALRGEAEILRLAGPGASRPSLRHRAGRGRSHLLPARPLSPGAPVHPGQGAPRPQSQGRRHRPPQARGRRPAEPRPGDRSPAGPRLAARRRPRRRQPRSPLRATSRQHHPTVAIAPTGPGLRLEDLESWYEPLFSCPCRPCPSVLLCSSPLARRGSGREMGEGPGVRICISPLSVGVVGGGRAGEGPGEGA